VRLDPAGLGDGGVALLRGISFSAAFRADLGAQLLGLGIEVDVRPASRWWCGVDNPLRVVRGTAERAASASARR
jgi:hypothetical protein